MSIFVFPQSTHTLYIMCLYLLFLPYESLRIDRLHFCIIHNAQDLSLLTPRLCIWTFDGIIGLTTADINHLPGTGQKPYEFLLVIIHYNFSKNKIYRRSQKGILTSWKHNLFLPVSVQQLTQSWQSIDHSNAKSVYEALANAAKSSSSCKNPCYKLVAISLTNTNIRTYM